MGLQIITDIEDYEHDHTIGLITPLGTTLTEAPWESVDGSVIIPVAHDEATWHEGLVDALADMGYILIADPIRDGSVVTAPVTRI